MAQGQRDEYILRAREKDTRGPGTVILEAKVRMNEGG